MWQKRKTHSNGFAFETFLYADDMEKAEDKFYDNLRTHSAAYLLIKKIEQNWKSSRLSPAKILKQALNAFSLTQKKKFFADCTNIAIEKLVYQRTHFIDQIIALLWQKYIGSSEATIIAVGGYGRGELFPYSDIDVLILLPNSSHTDTIAIKKMMHVLWDSGLDLKSNVCQLQECEAIMNEDISVMTSMLEARFVSGKWDLYQCFKDIVKSKTSSHPTFVEQKKQEMIHRHHKYNDSIYLLEPNLKESPSNLRDIHTVMWIARVALGITQFEQFIEKGYLSEREYQAFIQAMHHLWRLRFALHMLAKRDENRLLFDLQIRIAQKFGYKKMQQKHAVEFCMQNYYKQLITLRRICHFLLQEIRERTTDIDTVATQVINKRFQIKGEMIEMQNPYVFKRYPFALLEIFLIIQSTKEIQGIGAKTSRQMIEDAALMDKKYRQDIRHQSIFMEILKQREGVGSTLNSMHEHGILGAYIKEFADMEGLMQFDLFHLYTVDAHTLIVVRNLLNFFQAKTSNAHEYALAQSIPKPELLILAGLFHDLGKGGVEEHQYSGARIALDFCKTHSLSEQDCQLVSWLVQCHLEISLTAQKMNIHDPKVISGFLNKNQPQHQTDLDYLYLLTLADISATAPNLLNDYKYTLISQLWRSLKFAMEQTFVENTQQVAAKIKEKAIQKLHKQGFNHTKVKQFFNRWNHQYFSEQNLGDIIRQASFVLQSDDHNLAIKMNYNATLQATELLIWSQRAQYQFALINACLDQQNYSIIRAQVRRDSELYVLYSYVIKKSDPQNQRHDPQLIRLLNQQLKNLHQHNSVHKVLINSKKRLQDRRVKTLLIETQVYFDDVKKGQPIALNLITRDRPGLLALIGKILGDFKVLVVGAYVTTLGGKVEDKFYLLDTNQKPLNLSLMKKISKKIKYVLS